MTAIQRQQERVDLGSMNASRRYTFDRPEGLLAHYTKASVAFEHVLPERRLRMSPYRDMRDPAENKDIVPGLTYWGDPADPEGAWEDAAAGIRAIRDSCRVLSLTRDADGATENFGSCWARPRMWEQYADEHRGVCLLFDRANLVSALGSELKERGPLYLNEVRYTPAGIAESATQNLIDERILDTAQRPTAIAEYIENNYTDFFFLKSNDFETEHEYRAVLMAGDDDYAHVRYKEALAAVIVGERFPAWQLAGASEVCAKAGVPLRKMHWEHGRPFVLASIHR